MSTPIIMHYKDGTPAQLGDIVQHDDGSVGIVIGGRIGCDACSTHVVLLQSAKRTESWGYPCSSFSGALRDENAKIVAKAHVRVSSESVIQTRECLKIGHVDLGIHIL